MSDQQPTNTAISAPISTTDDSFEADVLNSDIPVLVDFWAEWCGPCKMIAPLLDEVAAEYAGKVKIVKVNIDENPKTPQKYAVRGIPALLVIKNGEVQSQSAGVIPKAKLVATLENAL